MICFERMLETTEKWSAKYPNAMKRLSDNWDCISPMFKFSSEVRKAIYTTNAIENLNSGHKRLNLASSVFPSAQALLKALYLATFELTKKWTNTIRNWGLVVHPLGLVQKTIYILNSFQFQTLPAHRKDCTNIVITISSSFAGLPYVLQYFFLVMC
jgi:hypothetical protein